MISKKAFILMNITFVIALCSCTPVIDTPYPTFGIPWLEEIHVVDDYVIYNVDWSPDSEHIAMVGYRGTVGQDVLVYNINNRTVYSILGEAEEFLAVSVSWSPDGDNVVAGGSYWTDQSTGGLWLSPLNGDPPRYLTEGVGSSWSPDGYQLAILEPMFDTLQIKLLDMNSGLERVLISMPDEEHSLGIQIEWSPNGEILAFTAKSLGVDGTNLNETLFIITPDHPEQQRLFPTLQLEVRDIAWFPDGEWMALIIHSEGNDQLQLASLEEECFVPLWPESNTAWRDVDVSPDGTQLIASNGDAYIIDLEAMAAEGLIEFPLRCP